jgi:hypothetical protein
VAIGVFIAGMIIIQQLYVRHRAPFVLAESTAANAEGEALFKQVGTPPESKPAAFGEKRFLPGRGQWRGAYKYITWERLYEMPGDYPSNVAWYRQRMLADGWRDLEYGQPSSVRKQFKKGKWIATIWRDADFPKYSRVRIELKWSYRHRVD